MLDRFAVETLGDLALAEQSADAGLDPQRPVGGCDPRAFGQPLECGPDKPGVSGPGRRLGQLGHDEGAEPDLIALERSPSGVTRGVVATETVVEHRAREAREGNEPADAACGRLPQGGLDQLGRRCLLAAPGRKQQRGIGNWRIPGRLCDQLIFVDQCGRRCQLASGKVGSGEEVDGELQLNERARIAGELNLASGQGVPGLGVPQLDGDRAARSGTGEPEPAAGLVGADRRSENQLECSGQRRRGRRVSLRQPDREPVEQDIHHPRRVGAGGRGARGLGHLQQAAGAVQVAGPHRGHERLQVRLTRQVDVERLEAPGRAHE